MSVLDLIPESERAGVLESIVRERGPFEPACAKRLEEIEAKERGT